MTYSFYGDCVGWPEDKVNDLTEMIDSAIDISGKTFLKHVNRDDLKALEVALGYSTHPKQGLTMAGDCHVSYHRSKVFGKRCYFFKHSAIEYVFTEVKNARQFD